MGTGPALVVAVTALVAGGAGLGTAIGMKPARWSEWAGFAGLSYLLGVCAFAILAQLLVVLGLPVWPALLLVAACAGLLWRARPSLTGPDRGPRADLVAIWIFSALVVAFAVLGVVVVLNNPVTAWDSWSIWSRKAIILSGGSVEQYFASPDYSFMHPDYPIGLPALQAAVYWLAGDTDTTSSDLVVWLVVPAGLAALAFLAPARPRYWAPLLLAMLALPPLAAQTLNGYADVPGALLVAGAVLAGGRWLVERQDWQLWVAGILIGGALCTKNEAGVIALGVLVLLSIFRYAEWRKLAWAWAVALLALVPWRVWLAAKGIEGDMPVEKVLDPGYALDNVERPWQALGDLLDKALFVQGTFESVSLAILLLGCLGLLLSSLRRTDARFALLAAFGSLAALLLAYWVSPYDLDWQLLNSSDRVIVTPVLILLTGALLVVDRPDAKERSS